MFAVRKPETPHSVPISDLPYPFRRGIEGHIIFENGYYPWFHEQPRRIRRIIGPLTKRPRLGDKLGRADYYWRKLKLEMELNNWHAGYDVWWRKVISRIGGKAWLTGTRRVNLQLQPIKMTHGAPDAYEAIKTKAIITIPPFLRLLESLCALVLGVLGDSYGNGVSWLGCSGKSVMNYDSIVSLPPKPPKACLKARRRRRSSRRLVPLNPGWTNWLGFEGREHQYWTGIVWS
jgi:hypothetical protein